MRVVEEKAPKFCIESMRSDGAHYWWIHHMKYMDGLGSSMLYSLQFFRTTPSHYSHSIVDVPTDIDTSNEVLRVPDVSNTEVISRL